MALSLLENTAWGSHRGQVLKNLLFYLAEQEELVNRESGKVACCTGKINLFLGIS
jgi:hypothetical protein